MEPPFSRPNSGPAFQASLPQEVWTLPPGDELPNQHLILIKIIVSPQKKAKLRNLYNETIPLYLTFHRIRFNG
jgi:hypothetical protein